MLELQLFVRHRFRDVCHVNLKDRSTNVDADEASRKQFDSDVRDLVKVKIIHGFWKNDDKNRIALLVWRLSLYQAACVRILKVT